MSQEMICKLNRLLGILDSIVAAQGQQITPGLAILISGEIESLEEMIRKECSE